MAANLPTRAKLTSAKPAARPTKTTTTPRTETTDPIFAALEAWRRADAYALCVAVKGNIPEKLADQHHEAFLVVIRTRPTTLAGLAAFTAWTREWTDYLLANGSIMHDEDLCTLTASIAEATAALVEKSAVLCGDMSMLEASREVPPSMMVVRKPARRKAVA